MADGTNPRRQTKWDRRGRWIAALALLTVVVAAVIGLARYRAEPVLRSIVIQTLSTRFKSKVELEAFHVSFSRGLLVSGKGLRIFGDTDPNNHEPGVQPIIEIGQFRFGLKLAEFLRSPMRVDTVYVSGLRLNLPPREDRAQMQRMGAQDGKIKIVVGTYIFEDAQLIINTLRPGKLPIEFNIANLKMTRTGANAPLSFEAELTNPKPTGTIFTSGYFGPWQADTPRETPLSGGYSFSHADLSTIKGLGGILSSKGKFDGTLEKIAVDGSTDTPDFRLAICRRPVPLHTDFHAIVDGTSGDTLPAAGKSEDSQFMANGKGFGGEAKNPSGTSRKTGGND